MPRLHTNARNPQYSVTMGAEEYIKDFSIEALQHGDESAFEALFLHFYPLLCYLAAGIIKDNAAAEDIAEETLVKTWFRRRQFESILHIKAFIYKATRNACYNFIKQAERKVQHHQVFSGSLEQDEFLSKIAETEVLRRLYSAINSLPEQCRKVIQLSYIEGWKADEIARHLQVSVSTVKAQKARGIELLKKRLPNNLLSILFFI